MTHIFSNLLSKFRSPSSKMGYRRLGRSHLQLSVIGFGTCQLRRIPEAQALSTLHEGFNLGVNFVHTAPDYEGTENIVAKAIRETKHNIHICTQAYDIQGNYHGSVDHFERLFEEACLRFGRPKIDIFGIACIDDREAFEENVWGKGGMVEFLQKKKAEGRIEAIFCTTHGSPEYIKTLLKKDVFDALMIAYNPLGFHLLSYHPPSNRHFEKIVDVPSQIFPLAEEKGVGLMIMKPLAGGLLCESKAFPPHANLVQRDAGLKPSTIFRFILAHQAVTCVVPGTASVLEAQENAIAGHNLHSLSTEESNQLNKQIKYLQTNLCSRCGICDDLCSQNLPISWLFRDSYISLFPSETFETWEGIEYFQLHPQKKSTCIDCKNITCKCPYGINIPENLINLHQQMWELRKKGYIRDPDSKEIKFDDSFSTKVIFHDLPDIISHNQPQTCRLYLENTSCRGWFPTPEKFANASVKLIVFINQVKYAEINLRNEVNYGQRTHFVWVLNPLFSSSSLNLRLILTAEHLNYDLDSGLILLEKMVLVI